MNLWPLGLPLIASSAVAAAPPALSFEALRLPPRLHAVGIGYRNDDTQPSSQVEVYEAIDRLWARQDWSEGSAGFVPLALTIVDAEGTLQYDIRQRRGAISNRFIAQGTTRMDGNITPHAWARLVAFGTAHGDTLREAPGSAGEIIVTLDSPAGSGRGFEATIDPATQQLREVRRGTPPLQEVTRYSDWRDFPDGSHAPFAVERVYPPHGTMPGMTLRFLVTADAGPISEAQWPTKYTFPSDAAIVNEANGQGTTAPAPPQPGPSNLASTTAISLPALDPASTSGRTTLLASGGLLIIAGVVVRALRARP